MLGPFSSRRGAALYLLVWLLLGVVLTGVMVSLGGAGWIAASVFAIPVTLVYAMATGFSAFYLCRAYPLAERNPAQIIGVFSLAALLFGFLWTALCHLWNDLLLMSSWEWVGLVIPAPLTGMLFGLGVLLYGLSAVVHYLAIEFERARLAERRQLESKLAARDAELRMLRTQIDPHFLFNSLNSISALTTQNPARAREMVQQLADFFRHSLGLEAHKKVTLEAESDLIEHFLAVEKVRFGARLQVEKNIDDDAKCCLVPPMLIQPLVENAIKHGIGNLTDGGTVRIIARRIGSLLNVKVENDVDDDLPPSRGNGIGLENVRQRLATAYGHEASVNWGRRDQLFWVEISMPAETGEL